MRAHCILQTYENTTDDNKISKRLYLLNNTINGLNVLVYDGLYNIKDKISLINYYETTSVDIGFYASGQSTKLSVLTSHNNNDTNLTLNTWASNLYWIIGDLYNTYDTSQTYKRLYKNSKSEISLITNILKNVYPAVVLNDGTSTNKYMYWIGSNLSSNFQQPSSTTQNAAHNNLYYTSIDTMWSSLTTTAIYNNYMTDLNGWQTGTISFSVAAVGSYDNEYQRKNYTGRCWPIRMYNDVILLENVYQNDKTKYIYDKDDGTKETLTGYTLNSGVPIITVKKGDKVKWKADFVNNTSTSTSVTTTLQLRYGKFDDTNGSAVTGVSYNSTTKEYSFTATKSGIVFAKWTKGHALSVSTSRKITVESTPI